MKYRIGQGSSIHLGAVFNSSSNFVIGNNSTINQFCRIDNRGGITIGDNVSIAPYVKLITADHDLNHPSFPGRERQIVIEDYGFIGADAMVLGGVTIKKGAVLGAKSLLTKSTKPFAIYAGVPAVYKGERNQDLDYNSGYIRWFH